MGQLFQQQDCPTCGQLMIMVRPSNGRGPRVLCCPTCDLEDPLKDDRVTGWLKGELKPPARR